MNVKKTLLILLFVAGLFIGGCSCATWTSFWGGDPCEECADHWTRKEKVCTYIDPPCPAKDMDCPIPCPSAQACPSSRPCPPYSSCDPGFTQAAMEFPVTGPKGSAIQLQKIAPRQITLNQPFEYKMTVTNLTDQELLNVVVKDVKPGHMRIDSSDPQASMEGGQMVWQLGSLAPRESRTIFVNAVATEMGTIETCADVDYDRPICAQICIVNPKIQVSKSAPADSLKCDRIPIKYIVTNVGTGSACDIQITDSLAPGLSVSPGGSEVQFNVGSLEAGQSKEFDVMADASRPGQFASKAMATSSNAGNAESDIVSTAVKQPVLMIKESCPAGKYIGRAVTYDIVVANQGDAPAKDTVVSASIPSGAQFQSASEGGSFSQGAPCRVCWNLGELMPNTSRTVSMTLVNCQKGLMVSRATASAYCADTVDTTCETTLSGVPAVLLEVVDCADPIVVGCETTYTINVVNQGSAQDTDIRITAVLEDNMQYVSSAGPTAGSQTGDTITFAPLASLAPGDRAAWTVTVKALSEGDVRFKAMMNTDNIERDVMETEATRFYK